MENNKIVNVAMGIDAEKDKTKKINLYLEDNGNREFVTVKDLIETIEKDKKFAEESGRLEEFLNEVVVMNVCDIHGQIIESKAHTEVGWCEGAFILSGNADSLEFVDTDKQTISLIRDEYVKMKKQFGDTYKYKGKREILETFYFTFGSGHKHNGKTMEGKYQPIKAINYKVAVEKMKEIYGKDWFWIYEQDEWFGRGYNCYYGEDDELETIAVEVE